MKTRLLASSAMLGLLFPLAATAQTSQQDALTTVTVYGKLPSLTAPATDQAAVSIRRIAGGATVVSDKVFKNGPADTVKDMLGMTAGVFTSEPRYGDDLRISIRGSGLSRPYGNRGVNMYMDGVPINTSDGLVDLFEIDPTAYRYVEIYKGANGLRYGANSLGGAINFVTPTGRDASPLETRVDVGDYGYERAQIDSGGVNGRFDYFVTASQQAFDGYRDHTDGHQERLSGNVGYRFSSNVETRFYLNLNSIRDSMAGELDEATALSDPKVANPDFTWKDQQRNIDSYRIANKTTVRLSAATMLDFGLYHIQRHVDHPNWSYLTYNVSDNGGFVRLSDTRNIGSRQNTLILGANVLDGTITSTSWWYANSGPYGGYASPVAGAGAGNAKGALASRTIDRPKNAAIYIDDAFQLRPNLTLDLGGQYLYASRPRENLLDESQSGGLSYHNATPKIGLLWDVDPTWQVFGNISSSAEAPSYDVNPVVTLSATLKAQTATTYELGARGRRERFNWDISVYRAELKNELQCVSTYPGSCSYVNADRTVHQGVEAGGGVDLASSLLKAGDGLRLDLAYVYNDFRFDNDAVYHDNHLAGAPTQYIRAELMYRQAGGLYAGVNTEIMPTYYYADNANTTRVDAYGLLNLKLGYDKPDARWSLYLEGRNLLDKRYIALVDVAGSATPASAIFYPGTGASVRAGIRFKM